MKFALTLLFLPAGIFCNSCLADAFAKEESSVVGCPASVNAEGPDDSMMHTTKLKSGLIVVENKNHPHERLDFILKRHFILYSFEEGQNLNVSIGKRDALELFSFSIYDEKMHPFCKYWFTLNDFSVLDYDGDGLADVRVREMKYEIRLNDVWTPCQTIQLKKYRAVLPDASAYVFKSGKWQQETP